MSIHFLFSFAFHFSSFLSYSKIPYSKGLFWPFFFGVVVLFYLVVSFIFLFLIIFFYFYSLHFVIAMLLLACFPLPLFSFFCCSSVLPCCSCFTYIFTFPNIFLIFTTLFCFLFFCYCTVLSFLLPHHAAGRILVPRLGVRREILWWGCQVQTTELTENLNPPGILIKSEVPSRYRDLAVQNWLQTPVLETSWQTTLPIKKERQPKSMLQTKEQFKNQQDQINEEETGNRPQIEFRVMTVKMIQNLGTERRQK